MTSPRQRDSQRSRTSSFHAVGAGSVRHEKVVALGRAGTVDVQR